MAVKVTWLGHACVQLEYEDKVILIDPWLENPKFPGEEFRPSKIDFLLITHAHGDHFGNAIELAKEFKPTIPVIHEMSIFLSNNGVDNVVGMNFGGTYRKDGIEISMVPSSHSGGFTLNNKIIYLGAPAGYVISFPDGNSFYHCGDTGVTHEMAITRDLFSPKYGLLAIGGHYTMDPKGAAYAAKMMKLQSVLPIHWGTFIPPLTGTPDELETELADTNIKIEKWSPGSSVTLQ